MSTTAASRPYLILALLLPQRLRQRAVAIVGLRQGDARRKSCRVERKRQAVYQAAWSRVNGV